MYTSLDKGGVIQLLPLHCVPLHSLNCLPSTSCLAYCVLLLKRPRKPLDFCCREEGQRVDGERKKGRERGRELERDRKREREGMKGELEGWIDRWRE